MEKRKKNSKNDIVKKKKKRKNIRHIVRKRTTLQYQPKEEVAG